MKKKITRQKLAQDALRHILDIEDMFNTASYWNRQVRKPDEEPINPDPNGEMAKNWLDLSEELIGLLVQPRASFVKHFDTFYPKNVVAIEAHRSSATEAKR